MLTDHLILALMWVLFCALHSLLANERVKLFFQGILKNHFRYYRFYYTLFALISLTGVLFYLFKMPSVRLFQTSLLTTVAGVLSGLAGLAIMLICLKKYLTQIYGLKVLVVAEPASNKLMISGIHRLVRHPLYLGTFLFIWGGWLLYPTLSFLISNVLVTAYTVIAIRWEERKLLAEFGESYRQYQLQVPQLIPFL